MITNEIIVKIGEAIASKIRCDRISKNLVAYKDNGNFYHFEKRGMEQILEIMGIDYEYEFDDDVTEIIAIKINGITIEI